MTEQEIKAKEAQLEKWGKTLGESEQELLNFSKEIQEREKAAAQWERELSAREAALQVEPETGPEETKPEPEEARRYDLFFDATNRHAARPVAAVILEPKPARQEVSRADLVAVAAMILSIGAVAASVAAVLL